ncbi:MAG TPA: hypothetical protein VN633_10610 [Bryobacteraceae bacterium]|nr:hypothetical protein [Bryobacteraceae bacterium]
MYEFHFCVLAVTRPSASVTYIFFFPAASVTVLLHPVFVVELA